MKQWAFGAYLVVLGLALITALVNVFPGDLKDLQRPSVAVDFFGNGLLVMILQPESRLIVLVGVAGALGAYVHLATSFADFVGTRGLKDSWYWWYVLRPFIGTALAMILYLALRGGLLAATSEAKAMSPFGVSAIGALAGLFSRQATNKLKDVFETLFAAKPSTVDTLPVRTAAGAGGAGTIGAADQADAHRKASADDDAAGAEGQGGLSR